MWQCMQSLSQSLLFQFLLSETSMATTPSPFPQNYSFIPPHTTTPRQLFPTPNHHRHRHRSTTRALPLNLRFAPPTNAPTWGTRRRRRRRTVEETCKAAEVSVTEEPSPSGGGGGDNWVPVVPLSALPKGERRVILQGGETILLLWYRDEIFAIENRSPAEGAYTEGLINAKLTKEGCIVCPSTESTFDLRTGAIREWYPKNPVLRALTPVSRLYVYPVKTDEENIYINMRGILGSDASAEIVFSGKAQPGVTASDVNVEVVRMVVDEDVGGFGFTERNEIINGKAAVIGFLLLLDFELLTGEGLLKGTGFLNLLYTVTNAILDFLYSFIYAFR
ncbi:hypothetical protein ACOSQ4_009304 [Xanthoceras sorbifolium]